MNSHNIPSPVSQFILAFHEHDNIKLALTFDQSAVLTVDEAKHFTTRSAITAWAKSIIVERKATIEVFDPVIGNGQVGFRVLMDGDFKPDYGITKPFTLYFHFDLTESGEKIQRLEITDLDPKVPKMRAVWAGQGDSKTPMDAIFTGKRSVPDVPEGWVKIKVVAVGLNYHDIFTLRGIGFHPLTFPLILGNEGVGTLDDGLEVMIYPLMFNPHFKGDNATLDPKRHVLGELTQGSLAEYVVVPKENVVPKPKLLTDVAAASLGIAWLTAYRMLFTHAKVTKGHKMLVQGSAGGVATALIQLGIAAGITVWTTGRSEEKRMIASKLGAHQTFEAGAKIPELVDAVFDMSGAQTLNHSVASVRAGGIVVLAGIHSGSPKVELDLFRIFTDQIKLVGCYLGTKDEFEGLIKFVAEKNIQPDVALVLPLEKAEEGLRKIYEGNALGKVVVQI